MYDHLKAVQEAYDNLIDERNSNDIAMLRLRADLAEAMLEARNNGISIKKQAQAIGVERSWAHRLARGAYKPPRASIVAVSRLAEGTYLGESDDWQKAAEGMPIAEVEAIKEPPPIDHMETVIIPKIPDCKYCNRKATRVIQYGNGRQAMVCEAHAPDLEVDSES